MDLLFCKRRARTPVPRANPLRLFNWGHTSDVTRVVVTNTCVIFFAEARVLEHTKITLNCKKVVVVLTQMLLPSIPCASLHQCE